jgi:proline dehydrogenase
MPGERIEAALDAAASLRDRGMTTTFTHLGENVLSEQEALHVTDHYREVLGLVRARGLDTHLSVKLTQLGLDIGRNVAEVNLRAIVDHAARLENFVWIDMESTAYTDVTIDLYRRMRAEYTNVGVCLQSYLRRTQKDLDELLALDAAVRLVKGAYAEPPNLAFKRRREVDESFFVLASRYLRQMTNGGSHLAYGTHDLRLIRRIQEEAEKLGLGKSAPEFHMLYGIQREAQERLAREGYRVRVLIAYGEYWFPWYMRRLAERPANVLFVIKNIFR